MLYCGDVSRVFRAPQCSVESDCRAASFNAALPACSRYSGNCITNQVADYSSWSKGACQIPTTTPAEVISQPAILKARPCLLDPVPGGHGLKALLRAFCRAPELQLLCYTLRVIDTLGERAF
eukprot:gene9902-biopygen9537